MLAVIDRRTPCAAMDRLNEICEVVELPPFSALDPRVASHPDMLMFAFDGKLFTSKAYYGEAGRVIDKIISLTSLELVLTDDETGNKYPRDIYFNTFAINNAIIGNVEYISKEIKKHASGQSFGFANVKQGYAKCSVCLLDEESAITADKGIAQALSKLGVDVCFIQEGAIVLEGYSYGFIGGASAVIDKRVIFFGDIKKHPDSDRILDFINNKGFDVEYPEDVDLTDLGSAIVIEKESK